MSGKPGTPLDHKISPVTASLLREIKDGEWHPLEKVIQKIIPKVHPGKAARKAEKARLSAKSRSKNPAPLARRLNVDMDQIIRIGARAIIVQAIRSRLFDVDKDNGRIRIDPERLKTIQELIERLSKKGGEAAFSDND